jgi:hypothetical protein
MAHPGGLSGLLQVYLVNVQFPSCSRHRTCYLVLRGRVGPFSLFLEKGGPARSLKQGSLESGADGVLKEWDSRAAHGPNHGPIAQLARARA